MLSEALNEAEDRLAAAELLLERVLAEYSSGLTKKTYALIADFLREED